MNDFRDIVDQKSLAELQFDLKALLAKTNELVRALNQNSEAISNIAGRFARLVILYNEHSHEVLTASGATEWSCTADPAFIEPNPGEQP